MNLLRDICLAFLVAVVSFKSAKSNSDNDESALAILKQPRHHHGSCKIVINEIYFGTEKKSFIEIAKLCGKKASVNTVTELKGYAVLLLNKNNDDFVCVKATKLTNKHLQEEPKNNAGVAAPAPAIQQPASSASRGINTLREQFQHRNLNQRRTTSAGNANRQPNSDQFIATTNSRTEPSKITKRSSDDETQTNAKMFFTVEIPEIPYFNDGAAIVVLLHIHSTSARGPLPCIPGVPIKDEQLIEIKRWLYDISILSSTSHKDKTVELANKLIPFKTNIMEIYDVVMPIWPSEGKSYSKCDEASKPRTPQGFKRVGPTKNAKNMCPKSQQFIFNLCVEFPFWFKGSPMLAQSNKLIINLVRSLKFYQHNVDFMRKDTRELASKLLNVALTTVHNAESKFKAQTIDVPRPKRIRTSKLLTFMNDHNQKLLRSIITEFYSQNKVPTVTQLHQSFQERARREQLECLEKKGPQTTDDCQNTDELFTCCEESFRKLLHKLGYKFGALNHRYSVLFNPDKVRWRRRYLSRVMEVRRTNEMNIIWLDETWWDPNQLPRKGWLARTCKDPREKAEFAFKKVKPGRGPRLIILAAGGKDGFIAGSNLVWSINAKDADKDFHGNVNKETFELWFTQLLDNLDKASSKKFLICMDNAQYHSVISAPKQTAKKHEILEFLQKEKQKGIQVPDNFETMLLVDLKKVLKDIKKTHNYFRIDQLCRERGHEIARLPPFNCDLSPIESVWKDIKFKLMQENKNQAINVQLQSAKIALNTYDPKKWENHERHIQSIEKSYWDSDTQFDNMLEKNQDILMEEDLDEGDGYGLISEEIADDDEKESEDDDTMEETDCETMRPEKRPRT